MVKMELCDTATLGMYCYVTSPCGPSKIANRHAFCVRRCDSAPSKITDYSLALYYLVHLGEPGFL
jgi:hypothetical protein